ncbi:MAG: response regulator [Longimicrobiales bacterium]
MVLAAGLLLLTLAAAGVPAALARQPLAIAAGVALVVTGAALGRRRQYALQKRLTAERARADTAEQREHTSERLRRRLIDAAGDALYIHDLSGRILDVNAAACESLGYTRDELLQMHIGDIELQEELGTLAERWGALREHEVLTLDGLNRRKDGTTFPVEARLSPLQDEPPQILALTRDVTTRAQLELQLRQSQKMQAIGRLAGGVAHDFNSLLTAIRGHTDLLLRERQPDAPEYGDLIEIMKAAERAAALTRQLLAFTRQQVFKPEVLDLNALIGELEPMLQRLVGENTSLALRLDATGLIRADRIQLEQVLLNLVMNARDAMPTGGALRIETDDERIDDVDPVSQPWMRRGAFTAFIVRDSGTGMDEEVLARAFEPFFTTKEKGPATGLGLSTAYGIVKQSGGFILMDSVPGQGTTFRVLLPRVDGRPAATGVPVAGDPEQPAHGGTILVAEDEEAVRSLISRVLQRQGYTVLEARDGEEALRLAHESIVPPDVLLTDIVMPRLGGPELARRLRRDMPGLRVILMSGYTDDAYVLHGALDDDVGFLGKPFAPDELARTIREALAGR